MRQLREFFREAIITIAELEIILQNEELIDKFVIYLHELKKWNKAYNLTSIEDDREIIIKHFIDSLLYLCFIPESSVHIADIGSGAGFPGIPISIVRENLKITLVEPSWKKIAFLKNIKRKLKLENVEIVQAKASDLVDKFDVVISRAVWSIKEFLKNCKALVKEQGCLIISKSKQIKEELEAIPDDIRLTIKEFTLPFFNAKRYIIKIELK